MSEDVLQAKASSRSLRECSDRGAQTGEKQEGATFLSVCWKETWNDFAHEYASRSS